MWPALAARAAHRAAEFVTRRWADCAEQCVLLLSEREEMHSAHSDMHSTVVPTRPEHSSALTPSVKASVERTTTTEGHELFQQTTFRSLKRSAITISLSVHPSSSTQITILLSHSTNKLIYEYSLCLKQISRSDLKHCMCEGLESGTTEERSPHHLQVRSWGRYGRPRPGVQNGTTSYALGVEVRAHDQNAKGNVYGSQLTKQLLNARKPSRGISVC